MTNVVYFLIDIIVKFLLFLWYKLIPNNIRLYMPPYIQEAIILTITSLIVAYIIIFLINMMGNEIYNIFSKFIHNNKYFINVFRVFAYSVFIFIIIIILLSFNSIVQMVFNTYKSYINKRYDVMIIVVLLLFALFIKILKYIRRDIQNKNVQVGDGAILFAKSLGVCYIIAVLITPKFFGSWIKLTSKNSIHYKLFVECSQSLFALSIAIGMLIILYLLTYMFIIECHISLRKLISYTPEHESILIKNANEYINYRIHKDNNNRLTRHLKKFIFTGRALFIWCNKDKVSVSKSDKTYNLVISKHSRDICYAKKGNICVVKHKFKPNAYFLINRIIKKDSFRQKIRHTITINNFESRNWLFNIMLDKKLDFYSKVK